MNRSGALIGASVGLIVVLAYVTADLPRPFAAWFDVALAVVIGAALGGFASPRAIATGCAPIGGIIAVLAFTPVMRGPVHGWIRRDSIPAERLDAVIVLSSGVSADSLLDAAAVERLLAGLALFRDNGARLLVTTRNGVSRSSDKMESDADRRRLIDLVTDTARWHAVGPVHTTHDEAVRTAALLLPLGQRNVAVVTSPLHTRRACRTFEKAGFKVTCVPADERLYAVHAFDSPATRLRATADWLYEQLAIAEYWVRGWV
jgi:uncharacterized SAM-binding protein YcdF (DUF218 family)